jgi:hypothetical protein
MVREDLKRLEALMMSSFDHSKSHQSHNSEDPGGRRSLPELQSLRHSLDSRKAFEGATAAIKETRESGQLVSLKKPDIKSVTAGNCELRLSLEDLE